MLSFGTGILRVLSRPCLFIAFSRHFSERHIYAPLPFMRPVSSGWISPEGVFTILSIEPLSRTSPHPIHVLGTSDLIILRILRQKLHLMRYLRKRIPLRELPHNTPQCLPHSCLRNSRRSLPRTHPLNTGNLHNGILRHP